MSEAGKWISSLGSGVITAAVCWWLGGPAWAVYGFGYLTFLIIWSKP